MFVRQRQWNIEEVVTPLPVKRVTGWPSHQNSTPIKIILALLFFLKKTTNTWQSRCHCPTNSIQQEEFLVSLELIGPDVDFCLKNSIWNDGVRLS